MGSAAVCLPASRSTLFMMQRLSLLLAGCGAAVAQHPTNQCRGPLPAGTDLSLNLASGQRNVALHRAVATDSSSAGGAAAGIVDGLSGPGHRWASVADDKPHFVIVDLAEVSGPTRSARSVCSSS